jgi:insecticidal toxin
VRRIDVDAQGVIHIEQQCQGADQQVTQFNYLIREGQLQLVAVTERWTVTWASECSPIRP